MMRRRTIMEPDKYSGRGTMAEFARASTDRVVARVERSCVINGIALTVNDGDRDRTYIECSAGILRWINHHHAGLLALVASTPDEAERYTPALRLDVDTLPVVVAD